ncbi:unnamed protein product [Peniophora sp. CBMAI 1063]|nr:unnamed protein product [Peniophora sp. CBMAI 1063]
MSSFRVVIFVALAACTARLIWRAVSSPLVFVLVSPLLLSTIAFGSFVLHIVLGHVLDIQRRSYGSVSARAARPLGLSTPAAWQVVLTRSQWAYKPPSTLPPIAPSSPVLSNSINDILILIVRDFILTWYTDISSSPSFPTAVSATLHGSLERVLAQLAPLDLSSILAKRILPKITAHIEHFRDSEVALRGAKLERQLTESEELDMLLAARYAGKGRLHPAVENLSSAFTKQSEETHLKKLVERALPYVLPPDEKGSAAVRIVVREVVACVVMYPIITMLSDPDFWNQQIDSLAGAAIRQQRLISKVRNVLETQLPSNPETIPAANTPPAPPPPETITVRTDARHFESFLRSISRTSSLLDARRLKNDIVGEIRRTRVLLANHEHDDWINGEKTEDVVAFLDRLYTAKRRAEERIIVLGGQENADNRATLAEPASMMHISLREVLGNPNSLSYFMEFLDRRDRSLLVQFWLTVESFKDPLESADSDSDTPDTAPLPTPGAEPSTAREDITMIYELYFAGDKPHPALSAVSAKYSTAIRDFATASPDESIPNAALLRKARRSVIRAQRQVEQAMEADFEEFERSELWFRVVEDITAARGSIASTPAPALHHPSPVRENSAPPMLFHALIPPPVTRTNSSPSSFLFHPSRNHSTPSIKSTSSATPPDLSSRPETHHAKSSLDLLMSPVTAEGETSTRKSRVPLFDDPENPEAGGGESHEKIGTVAAIQAALTDIITQDSATQQSSEHERERDRGRRPHAVPLAITSSTSARGGLFDDFEERPPMRRTVSEDSASLLEPGEPDVENDGQEPRVEDIAAARIGDLQLAAEVARLADKLAALRAQDAMLDTLIKQADLSGDEAELRLLRTSKSALGREIRALAFQREQYAQQDAANALVPERTKLHIVNAVQGEEQGRAVVRYLVEVQQLALDGSVATGWVVARRYNEFLTMHNKLRERFPSVRTLDFPRKHLVTSLSASFVDTRRTGLEKYIQNVVLIPSVCESDELRTFLSRNSPFIAPLPSPTTPIPAKGVPGAGFVRSMYTSVAGSIDDMFFGPSMLDVIIQRLTKQAAELQDAGGVAMGLAGLELPGANAFTAPISDFILAVFELNKKNNWLRRHAVVVILQQVLGSTVERKLRETISTLLDEAHLLTAVRMFKDNLWPGGKLKSVTLPRTAEQKQRTRDDANRKLSALVPDLAANMIGRSNARRGARRIFAVLQNRRLNQHILYTVLDELFASIFPDEPSQAHAPNS